MSHLSDSLLQVGEPGGNDERIARLASDVLVECEYALRWIGKEASREDFERRWNTVQDVACRALHTITRARGEGVERNG